MSRVAPKPATFVALLRGINVGRAKRLPMAELRAVLAGLGYTDVVTLLNSGNAVFRGAGGTPREHAERIAAGITERFELDVPVIVKSARELDAIVAGNPLADAVTDPSRLLVAFAPDSAALAGLALIASTCAAPDRFVVGRYAAYLHCPTGVLASRAANALLGKAGHAVTTRNWATVLKIQAVVAGIGGGTDATG